MTRVAIVGAQSHHALAQVWRRVGQLTDGTTVVSGGAVGVDIVAALSARQRGLTVEEHLPDYTAHGDRAPLERNTTIATTVDSLEAFPWEGCRGTWDAVRKARAAGVPVTVHEPDVAHQGLLVFTSRISFAGTARLQITRHGETRDPAGEPFAPTAKLLERALVERERADEFRAQAKALSSRQLLLGEPAEEVAARGLRAAALIEQAEQMEAASWAYYEPRFRAEMRVSYGLTRGTGAWARQSPDARKLAEEAWERGARPHPEAWRRLLARRVVVGTCFCVDARFCHRAIWRAQILPALGAVDGGEVPCR
jgi:hypothetical protein